MCTKTKRQNWQAWYLNHKSIFFAKKCLTNAIQGDKIVKLSWDGDRVQVQLDASKKLKKVLKKVLTNENEGDIITKLSARAGSELDLENWTTKDEICF